MLAGRQVDRLPVLPGCQLARLATCQITGFAKSPFLPDWEYWQSAQTDRLSKPTDCSECQVARSDRLGPARVSSFLFPSNQTLDFHDIFSVYGAGRYRQFRPERLHRLSFPRSAADHQHDQL